MAQSGFVNDQSTATEDALRRAVDTTPAFIHTGRPDGYLDYFNRGWLDLLGKSLDEVCGWRWTESIHPEDVDGIVQKWRAALASGEPFEAEARVRCADGTYRMFLHRKIPLHDEHGKIVKWFGSSIDIEDRKQTEFYLSEGQRLAHMGSWAFGPSGFDYWSPELFRIYGLDPANKPPTFQEYLDCIHPEDREFMANLIKRILVEASPFDITKRIVRPNGEVRYIRCVSAPVVENQTLKKYVGSAIDVTEHELLTQELRSSEAYLAEAQRLSKTGSWAWNPATGEIRYWSEECYRVLGFDPHGNPPLFETFFQRLHPDDQADTRERFEKAIRDKADFELDYRIVHPDKGVRDIHVVGHAVLDRSGDLAEFVGTVIDITERKRAEDRIRLVINTVPGLLWSARPDGWVDFINQRWLDYTGMTLEQALGWGWAPAYHADEIDEVLTKWRAAVAEGKPLEIETRLRRFDGEYRWFLERVFPLFDRTGHILGWYGSDIDIHERKLAEEKIREQETELRQILDLTPQHLGVLGPDGSPLYTNHAALEYFGITMDQWLAEATLPQATRSWLGCRLDLVHPDDREHFLGERKNRFLKGAPHEFEARLLRHDGEFRWFLFRLSPLKDERGHITRWYGTATDIEDRKQAEEEIRKENIALREELGKTSMFEEVIGTSSVLQAVLARAAKVAPTDSTVLIMGETGTGKELIARAIHKRSKRSERPFISVNCAAVPSSLIMSELFGHEKGAFTGAVQRRLGRFELAEGGTIFLDEVGDLPMETQIALLRVLQEREFERVGGTEVLRADVRVISATNRDLQTAIADGAFRSDLYYRLNVFPIKLPPLRERKEDVPLLVNYFVDHYATRAGKKIKHIQKKSLEALREYSWPGNVRELQNVIERSLIIGETTEFSVDKSWIANEPQPASSVAVDQASTDRKLIEAALAQSNGKVSGAHGAAAKLGMPPSTLESKIRSLRINKFEFKGV